jgi:hypothetical protein
MGRFLISAAGVIIDNEHHSDNHQQQPTGKIAHGKHGSNLHKTTVFENPYCFFYNKILLADDQQGGAFFCACSEKRKSTLRAGGQQGACEVTRYDTLISVSLLIAGANTAASTFHEEYCSAKGQEKDEKTDSDSYEQGAPTAAALLG